MIKLTDNHSKLFKGSEQDSITHSTSTNYLGLESKIAPEEVEKAMIIMKENKSPGEY